MASLAQVEVFYDGECPICVKEIRFLKWCDRKNGILFTDIAADEFDADSYGFTQQDFMDEIRGRLPDGSWIQGVEVFRRLYAAIGLGPVVFLTRLPLITQMLDLSYRVFARNRLRLTGRCSADGCEKKSYAAN